MKKLIAALLSVLLILSVMTSTAVVAQEVPGAEQVIDIDALDADTAPDTESYTIVDDGEPLLEVVHVKESGVTRLPQGMGRPEVVSAQRWFPWLEPRHRQRPFSRSTRYFQ